MIVEDPQGEIMELVKILEERRSCRAFLPFPVDREKIRGLLEMAKWAPSALNLQPWEVTVVMGKELERLTQRLLRAYSERKVACSPGAKTSIPESHQIRRRQSFGPIADATKSMGQDPQRFVEEGSLRFYGAPVALVICRDKAYGPERNICIGAFLGYLVLCAHDVGLATCPLGLPLAYVDELKDQLNIDESKEVMITVAVGYPDLSSPLASFRTPREPLESFVRWYG